MIEEEKVIPENTHEKVYVVCENMCLEEGYTKEQIDRNFVDHDFYNNIEVLTGALSEGVAQIGLENYNWNKYVVLSVMFRRPGQNAWATGTSYSSGDLFYGSIPYKIVLKENVIELTAIEVLLANGVNPTVKSAQTEYEFRLVLMRVS